MKHVKKEKTLLDKVMTPDGERTPNEQLQEIFQDWANIFSKYDDKK